VGDGAPQPAQKSISRATIRQSVLFIGYPPRSVIVLLLSVIEFTPDGSFQQATIML
jgi:hypothetical protein